MTDDEVYVEIEQTLAELDATIEATKIQVRAQSHGGTDYAAQDATGRPLLADLLCAKAQCLAALANRPTGLVVEPRRIELPKSDDSDLVGGFPIGDPH